MGVVQTSCTYACVNIIPAMVPRRRCYNRKKYRKLEDFEDHKPSKDNFGYVHSEF